MFAKITDSMYASPQIDASAIAEAKALGITLIVNNRPEGESDDQTPGSEIEAAAKEAGIAYTAIPITHGGFSEGQVDAMIAALESSEGPALGYCRSGTRSTLLWSLARAKSGDNPGVIAAQAAAAGYDISPIRQIVDVLAASAKG